MLLRKAMINLIHPHTALDLFAGNGEIAGSLYLGFEALHCVEKDPLKFHRLEKISASSRSNIHLHMMDNNEFLETRVHEIPGINLVDFDAYGSPNPQIRKFFANYKLTQPSLVFATDGGKLAHRKGGKLSTCSDLCHNDSVLDERMCNPRFTAVYEKLIYHFWLDMARANNFSIKVFRLLWKKRKQVAYYGLLVSPK